MIKNRNKNLFDDKAINKFLKKICEFKLDKRNDETNVNSAKKDVTNYKYIVDNQKYDKRIWLLIGREQKGGNWACLEVGSSNNIKKEIRENIGLMISKQKRIPKDSEFHKGKELFLFKTYSDRASCKYRSMTKDYREFIFYEVNIDSYKNEDKNMEKIKEKLGHEDMNVANYVEVSLAYYTEALYWNPAPTIRGNQEREILEIMRALFDKKTDNP